MAITVLQGTFSGSSTTPAVDIRTMLATQFAAIGGNWSVVDNGYTNGTTVRTVIANSAGFAVPFFTSTTTTVTDLFFAIGSDYNVGTHTLNNIGFGITLNTTATPNSTGYSGLTYNPTAMPSANNDNPAPNGSYNMLTATAAQTNWIIVYDTTYAIIGIKDGTTNLGKWFYIGAFDTLVANSSISDTINFCTATSYSTSSSRYNGAAFLNATASNSGIAAQHGGYLIPMATNFIGAPGTTSYNDKFDAAPTSTKAAPIYLARGGNDIKTLSVAASTAGWLRGKLKDVVYTDYTGSAWGDTTSIGTSTYMYIGGISSSATATTTVSGWVRIS